MTSQCIMKLLFILEMFIACDSFIFDTSNATSQTPSTHTVPQTPVATTTSSQNYSKSAIPISKATIVPTQIPDKEYQQLIDVLMDDRRARVQLEQKLVDLQTNISDVLDGFEVALNNTDEVQILKLINDLERNFSYIITDVKQNVTDLNADQKSLEKQCANISDMYIDTNLTYQLQNLTIETHRIDDELLVVKNKTGLQSGFTVTRPTSGPRSGTITFHTAITNINNDFNVTSGEFTCSISGVYFFMLTMYKYSIADFAYCSIRHNGTDVMEAYSNPNVKGDYGFYSASTTLYVHLERGDTIDLGHCTPVGTLEYRTTFTGFLVNAD